MRVVRLMVPYGFALGFALSFATGCSTDDAGDASSTVGDTTEDRGRVLPDQGEDDPGAVDSSLDWQPVDTGPVSDSTDEEGTALQDLQTDVAPGDLQDTAREDSVESDANDPWADRPLGQCAVNDDCPSVDGFRSCARQRPGGVCSCRLIEGGCPNSSYCSEDFPSCVEECSTQGSEEDCPPGLVCGLSLRCLQLSCVSGLCPVPMFGCDDSGRCARIECGPDVDCPDRTTCTDGYCVEDRLLE